MFPVRPVPPVQPVPSNSGKALVLRIEHWTPKGDCKVAGNKERNYEGNSLKKAKKKMKSPSNLHLA